MLKKFTQENWDKAVKKSDKSAFVIYISKDRCILFQPCFARATPTGMLQVAGYDHLLVEGPALKGVEDGMFHVAIENCFVSTFEKGDKFVDVPFRGRILRFYRDEYSYEANDGISPASIQKQVAYRDMNVMILRK